MGIENLVVRFDDPSGVFYAGQTVSGVVQFQTTQPYQSDGVFIKFVGRADVHWTETKTTNSGHHRHHGNNRHGHGNETRTETVHYRAHEMYLDQKVCLYSPPGGNLQPYNYSFPFAMQLPLHIPSSFIGSVGKIHYRVKANVHRRGMHMPISRKLRTC